MSPEVTIKVSFAPDGTAVSTAGGTGDMPVPMALDRLHADASASPNGQPLPVPMPIEELHAAARIGTPASQPLGAPPAGGLPEPRPLEELGAAPASALPVPLPPEALGAPAAERRRATSTRT